MDVTPLREKLLEAALAELGKGEAGGNNRGRDVDRYRAGGRVGGMGGSGAWCAAFVSYCYRTAAAKLGYTLPFETTARAKKLADRIGAAGKFIAPDPFQMAAWRGGVIAWHGRWGPLDPRGHIGIILRYDAVSDSLHTIEGNKGPLVCQYAYHAGSWRKRLYRVALV